jgi:hypothetical protein
MAKPILKWQSELLGKISREGNLSLILHTLDAHLRASDDTYCEVKWLHRAQWEYGQRIKELAGRLLKAGLLDPGDSVRLSREG